MKKSFITIFVLCLSLGAFSQTNDETIVLNLSAKIFKWEVDVQSDSLKNVFHEKLQVWGTSGEFVNKTTYLERLSSPNFIHNKVTIEKSAALIADNTAIVNGDGIFELTVSGNKVTPHLSYTEVFTRKDASKPWMLVAIYAKPKGN